MAKWGMVIDLDKCTMCGACIASCHIENNVAIVGPDEAKKNRTIFWMDTITFQEGEHPNTKIKIVPRPCMNCQNPLCTYVCPVNATQKGEDGIIGQIYPRCIGCRYCAVACPYTVKYFNWYKPEWVKKFKKTLNPDVSLRPRGVVEKCTFCIHRLQKAREKARAEDRRLVDGDFMTACAESCPTKAISFGDLEDKSSMVYELHNSSRAYRIFDDMGTEPTVYYLTEDE
ncbi:MAG: 4Fe-4S dicluster domain-containing protein [Thermodesulfovibrionia bacterium]